jgi:hypothetical protein
MKSCFVGLCLVLLSGFRLTFAQSNESGIRWDSTSISKRVPSEWTEAAFEFAATNTSKTEKVVKVVATSCGCTTVTPTSQVIGSGEKKVFSARMVNQPGRSLPTVRIISVAVQVGDGQIEQLTGTIVPDLRFKLSSNRLVFLNQEPQLFEIEGNGTDDFNVVELEGDICHAKVVEHNKDHIRISVALRENVGKGQGRMQCKVVTGSQVMPLHIPVLAYPAPPEEIAKTLKLLGVEIN